MWCPRCNRTWDDDARFCPQDGTQLTSSPDVEALPALQSMQSGVLLGARAFLAAGWVEGYRESSPLHWADLDEACAWSMIRRLTMLGWQQTHRPDALPAELWAEYAPGTLDVAARYLDDPRALVR